MFDLIINNALIYDGSGAPAYHGSIGVKDGKIVAVSSQKLDGASNIVDASGLCLAPGFIDVHSHADYAFADDPHRLHVLRMGVTTEIAGNCGKTLCPALPEMQPSVKEFMNP